MWNLSAVAVDQRLRRPATVGRFPIQRLSLPIDVSNLARDLFYVSASLWGYRYQLLVRVPQTGNRRTERGRRGPWGRLDVHLFDLADDHHLALWGQFGVRNRRDDALLGESLQELFEFGVVDV